MKATIEEQIEFAMDIGRIRSLDQALVPDEKTWTSAVSRFGVDRYVLNAKDLSPWPQLSAYKPGDTIYAVRGIPEPYGEEVLANGLTLSDAMAAFFRACMAWHHKIAAGLSGHPDIVAAQLAKAHRIEEFVSR